MPRHRRRHRRKVGGSFKSFWGKAKKFLKKTKLLSTVGNALAPMAGPGILGKAARGAVNFAKSQGYGRRRRIRRRRKGGALRPAGSHKRYGRGTCGQGRGTRGGSLAPVGAGRRRRKHHSGGKMNPRLRGIRMGPRMTAKF